MLNKVKGTTSALRSFSEWILFNSLIQPYTKEEWPEASEITGIYPNTVKNAPYAHNVLQQVKGIIEKTNKIVGYNVDFDIRFLKKWGLNFDGKEVYDVMEEFAAIYGDWSEKYESYKYQKLSTCAKYFGYTFNAHDSLEDAKATSFCYKKIQEFKNKK